MKRLSKIMVVIGCIAVALLLIVSFGHITDTNGTDKSLCTLTDEDIFAQDISDLDYNAAFIPYHTLVGEDVIFGAQNLSGIYLVDEFYVEGENIVIQSNLVSLLCGNLRIVLLCDGEYVRDFPLGENERITIENAKGCYEIRVAAESAVGLEVRVSYWREN